MPTTVSKASAQLHAEVDLVVLPGVGHEGIAIRGVLEELGARVNLLPVGSPADLLAVLDRGTSAPSYMITCAHGLEAGLALGDYEHSIDSSLLNHDGVLPASEIGQRANLPGSVVLNTACFGSQPATANAFLAAGAASYVGSPDGVAAVVFITLFFYEVLKRGADPATACERVASYDSNLERWKLFTP